MPDRRSRKSKIGQVISDKMDKSIVVSVERRVRQPLYKKYVKKTSTFMAHDAENQCNIGDKVKIVEIRPLSKRKRWRLVDVIEKAK